MSSACGDGSDYGERAEASYLPRSHSHNNYLLERPLHGAVQRGFASIEVDVFLRGGELYVAHEPKDIEPEATLTELYLEPLRQIVRRNGGRVYGPSDPPLQLLIDVKSEAEQTYVVLREALAEYEDILTTWTVRGARPGAVTAVLSGNRAIRLIEADSLRYVAIDGRLDDVRATLTPDAMPLVSASWERLEPSGRDGRLATARKLVEQLHREGRKVRFWGTPDREAVWSSLDAIGVDFIGTDDVTGLEGYLRRNPVGSLAD